LLRVFDAVAEEEDFNRFDAALCDVPFDPFLFDLFAAVRLTLATPVFEAFEDFAGRLGEVLGDFLRDFLDIRLPFVAFDGSIMGVLRVLAGAGESRRWLGKSDGLGVWLQGIRPTACRSLNEL
jgi:hypothetical protein